MLRPRQLLLLLLGCAALPRSTSTDSFTYLSRPGWLELSHFRQGVEKQIVGIFEHALRAPPGGGGAANYTVYDIGMNAGFFTLLAAARGATVHSFEPQPECVRVLRESLEGANAHLRPRVTVANVALGHKGVLAVPAHDCHGFFSGGLSHTADADAALHNVPIVALRAFVPSLHPVQLVKIDTEGAEVPVLQELLHLARTRLMGHLVVELLPNLWARRGASVPEVVAALEALQAAAARTLLLSDPKPFGIVATPADDELPSGVDGPAFSGFNVTELVRDRMKQDAGCNVWFSFQ